MPTKPLSPVQLAQASFKYFCVKFLEMKWPSHYQEWYDLIENNSRLLIQCPRGHGKSWLMSMAYPLWRVIRGKRDILLVSYSEDQVKRLIREIRTTVETNPYLEALRPTTKEVWGTDQLSFANGSFISGLGFGTSSRGRHPDDIIVDDPLKDMGGMSSEDQERAFFGVLTGMAMEKTKIIVVGTPVSFDDLLLKLENNEAYSKWKKPALDAQGNPLFPELKSKTFLEQTRKEMGALNFAREYMLERIDPTTQPFKREYEQLYSETPVRDRFMCVATVCDPAYTENDGDATAIVTTGITHGNHAYVLAATEIRREDPGLVVDELFKHISRWEPDTVGIKRRKGDAISFTFNERRTRGNYWDFKYVEIKDTKSKTDMSRIGGLVPRWEAGTIHLHKNMTSFLKQIYEFRMDDRHAHDDLLDALADCFSPEMSQPNSGKRRVKDTSYRDTHPLFNVGQKASLSRQGHGPTAMDALWKRLDRRVGDRVAA